MLPVALLSDDCCIEAWTGLKRSGSATRRAEQRAELRCWVWASFPTDGPRPFGSEGSSLVGDSRGVSISSGSLSVMVRAMMAAWWIERRGEAMANCGACEQGVSGTFENRVHV